MTEGGPFYAGDLLKFLIHLTTPLLREINDVLIPITFRSDTPHSYDEADKIIISQEPFDEVPSGDSLLADIGVHAVFV